MLLWWLDDSPRLGPETRALIAAAPDVYVSAASVWEVAIKRQLGKLDAPDDLLAQMTAQRFLELSISAEDAWVAGGLAPHHTDPFDRMIAAQALQRGCALVTADAVFERYGVDVHSATA